MSVLCQLLLLLLLVLLVCSGVGVNPADNVVDAGRGKHLLEVARDQRDVIDTARRMRCLCTLELADTSIEHLNQINHITRRALVTNLHHPQSIHR